jgi:hypothetical protein
MQIHLGGRQPEDPSVAGMRQLKFIACTYATTCAGAAKLGASALALGLVEASGLAHAFLASRHGIKRGEQDQRTSKAEVATEPEPSLETQEVRGSRDDESATASP